MPATVYLYTPFLFIFATASLSVKPIGSRLNIRCSFLKKQPLKIGIVRFRVIKKTHIEKEAQRLLLVSVLTTDAVICFCQHAAL